MPTQWTSSWIVGPVVATVLLAGSDVGRASSRDLTVMPKVEAGSVAIGGEYWALLIGIDQYQQPNVPKLQSAVRDTQAVREVLVQRYGFARDKIIEIINAQATREGIENAFYQLRKKAGKDDSVFIYYAGHGQIDQEDQIGYWVPVEGKAQSPGTFISNARIRDEIARMKAKHVYLVADSCFSGTLFASGRALPPLNDKFFQRLYANKSRWGLTSGQNEPVTDQGKDGHSMFAYFFLKLLKENEDPYLVPSHIYDQIAPLIGRNTDQQPRSEPLQNAGDEGGQFVFRLVSSSLINPSPKLGEGRVGGGPSVALSQAERELKDLGAQERQAEEQKKLAEIQNQIEEKKKKIELAKAYPLPLQAGKEFTGKDGAPMVLVPEGEFIRGENRASLGVFIRDVEADDAKKFKATEGQGALIVDLDPAGPGTKAGLQQDDIILRMGDRQIGKAGDLSALLLEAAVGWRTTAEIIRGGERKRIPVELGATRSEGKVYVDAFYMDKYEVTTDLYAKFLQATGRKEPDGWTQVHQVSAGNRPVIGVDWHDADAYCRYYGKRLPTEAEWEKAARGTDGRVYPWGNQAPTTDLANYGRDRQGQYNVYTDKLKPVGSYEAGKSPFGAYDMAGNVWEWVADWFGEDVSSPGRNPTGPTSGTDKVRRGGAWSSHPQWVRSVGQGFNDPSIRGNNLGFRCAKTP